MYAGEVVGLTVFDYTSLMSVKMEFEDEIIIFHVTFPLVDANAYHLIKLWTLPFRLGSQMYYIDQPSTVMAEHLSGLKSVLT